MNNQIKPVWDLAELLDEIQDMIEERNAIYYDNDSIISLNYQEKLFHDFQA